MTASNGYLYIAGGLHSASDTACVNTGAANARCNDIQRMTINADGSLGAISTSYFNVPREGHAMTASNGYLYIAGGTQVASDTACVNTGVAVSRCNDIQRMAINADGSLGAILTSYYNIPRHTLAMTAANGYLYISGGTQVASDTACVNTGVAVSRCNDIQRMAINADGSLGVISTSYFNTPRSGHAMTAANGYLYISGGFQEASDTACKNNGAADNKCNDIQRMAINADGSLGAIYTSYFNLHRYGHTMTVSNGYLYIAGGWHSTSDTACVNTGTASNRCNDIQRMAVNADGSLGTISTSYFNTPRAGHVTTAANGYLYIAGGVQANSDTACVNTGVANNRCNDIQRMAIAADGSLGTISTSYFNTPRSGHAMAAWNGYLYISGGLQANSDTACVNTGVANNRCNDIQRMAIASDGSLSTISTSYFNVPRADHAMATGSGYLYITGGVQANSDTACVNTGTASTTCNDIQRMAIASDGSLSTISTSYFNVPRADHAMATGSGYLYITGGVQANSDTACVNTGTASTTCNDIQRMAIASDGSLSTISTSYFNTPRSTHAMTVANGYLYIAGGFHSTSDTACVNTGTATDRCNDIQRMAINADGSLGTISTSYFNTPRSAPAMSAANGYLYIAGGIRPTSDTACVNTGTANTRCNDIQTTPINNDGNLGAGATSYFNVPRRSHALTAVSGYLYISGGTQSNTDTACVNTGTASTRCNDIQRMAVNADGSLGVISTSYFNTPRSDHAMTAANSYLYISGGSQAATDTACKNNGGGESRCNDIQRMAINADGSLGTISTSYFNTPRDRHAMTASSGYLYISGGFHSTSDTACVNTGVANPRCNDIQRMTINADGSLGTISTSYFNTPRDRHAMTAANGYLYIAGGEQAASDTACVNTGTANTRCNDIQRMAIAADGSLGAISTSYFNTPRNFLAMTAGGGYLYIAGGFQAASDTACVNTGTANFRCNDIQRMQINADGSLGAISTSYFNVPRIAPAMTAGGGYLYIAGGEQAATDTACVNTGVANARCNDIQRMAIGRTTPSATYTRQVDFGRAGDADSIVINGSFPCGLALGYRTAGNDGVFGALVSVEDVRPGVPTHINRLEVRYVTVTVYLNKHDCGGANASLTDITFNYTLRASTPTLSAPADSTPNASTTPTFQLRAPDDQNDYLRYKIEVCSTADCSTVVRTIDQTASQTGWSGQDQQTGTAYTGNATISLSTMASHAYQGPALSPGTTYWWRGYAIDPADTNTFSRPSATFSFVTQAPPGAPELLAPSGTEVSLAGPQFRLRAADPNGDYLRYRIQLCGDATCSTVLQTFDQTASQTGWSGQDAASGTAYAASTTASGSTTARYGYAGTALAPNTQYWWRAYAIDPGGSNTYGPASSISTFTTAQKETMIRGNVNIRGNTRFGS